MATSLLGMAAISCPKKAIASNNTLNLQPDGIESDNLGNTQIAEQVLPQEHRKPNLQAFLDDIEIDASKIEAFEIGDIEPATGNPNNGAGFAFDGSKPEEVKTIKLAPPPAKQAQVSDEETAQEQTLPEEETSTLQDLEEFAQEQLQTQGYEELEEHAQTLADNEEEFNENYLLLKVTSGKYVLNQGLSAYDVNGQLYISLYELTDTVDFPIEVFDEEKRAEGWFIETGNDFYLSLQDKELIISGRSKDFSNKDARLIDEEIYVSSDALKDWFGLNFDLNFSRLTLDLESTEKLEFEKKIARQQKWKQAGKSSKRKRKEYPKIDLPYKMAEMPSSTVVLSSNYNDTAGKQTLTGGYSVQGSGDLLNMSAEYFLSGNDQEAITEARVKLFRYDNDGVFEGTDIKQFEIGDISPTRLNLAGGGSSERGVKVSNKPLGTVSTPDNILIQGEVEPGWEVELYRNDEFIAFLSETEAGRYEFDNLSLLGGLNLFRIVKYGPFGEREEEFQRYFIGPGMLKQGEFNYEASVSQANKALLPNTAGGYEISGGHRVVATAEYGVTENLSLGGGVYSGQILDEYRNAVLLSGRASILGTFNTLDHLLNDDGTSISSFSNRINLEDFNISSFATYNSGFDVAEEDSKLSASANVSTRLDLFGLLDLSLQFGGEYETFQTDKVRHGYSNQISTTIQGFALSNKVNWDITDSAGNETKTANGEFFFRKRFDDFLFNTEHDILFRTSANYKIEPEESLDSLNVRVEKNIDKNIRLRLNVAQNFGAAEKTTYNVGTSYNHDYFSTGVNLSYDSDDDMAASLNFRFNVGPDHQNGGIGFIENQQAQRGTVVAFAYLDKNANSKFDGDDTPIEDVVFKSRFGLKGSTNESGVAFISGFSGYKTDDIYIDQATLPDIFYVPLHEGHTIVPRPGNSAHIEFPILIGGEIDGTIALTDEALNSSYDFSQFEIALVDKNGKVIKEISADQTGYYIFEQVIPGNYTVKLDTESMTEQGYVGEKEKKVSFTSEDPIVEGLDFTGSLDIEEEVEEEITDKEPVQQ